MGDRLDRRGLVRGGFGIASRRFVGLHGKALAVEHRGLAGPLAFDQAGADFRRRRGVAQRAGDQPQLHAEPVCCLP